MHLDAERLFEIEPGLFQSSRPGLYPPPGVSVVLNVSSTPNEFVEGHGLIAVIHLPLADHAFPGIEWLDLAVDWVISLRQRGHNVLVHCDRGESRSSLVLVAYLMRSRGLDVDASLWALMIRNPHADPNHRFMDGLREYERVCRGRDGDTLPGNTSV